MEHACSLKVAERVRLVGHRSDVERILAALDLFVLSSRSEGLSNTVLEAMASGKPVIATRVGGADEMVVDGETGLLVPAGDAASLTTAMSRLVTDPQLRQTMGSAARRRASTEFNLEAMVRSYESMYLTVADRKALRVP
jgi:glycosyltransferase involved in cell wall biosynthesis